MIAVARTEIEVAANTILLLREAGMIGRGQRPERICAAVGGVTPKDLELARHRAERHGLDGLRPQQRTDTALAEPHVEPEAPLVEPPAQPRPRHPRLGHPGEKLCNRCGEWVPLTEFDARGPSDPCPQKMCKICVEENARDHFVAVRKARALKNVIAFVTATRGDAYVEMSCARCGEPLVLGQCVTMEAIHAKCPVVK